jgi:flagellar biosynthesis protein FlhB
MSKQDIKEEYKRNEGDPFLKSRIRGQQQRMARGRMMANVPKATVVVTNPTHLALALEYQPGMGAPKLLAKGAHKLAARIVAVARANHIPTVQNIPLAHAIYGAVEVNQEIPPDLYKAVAEVLAYVYRLQGRQVPARSIQPSAH